MITPFIALYALEVIGLSPAEWGLVSTVETVIILLLRVPGGWVADRYSRRRLLILAAACDMGYFLAFIYSRSFT